MSSRQFRWNFGCTFRFIAAVVLSLTLSAHRPAHALRTALFPEAIRKRAAVWLDQDRVFQNESAEDLSRPIWIHAGDSMATAWANGGTLGEQYAAAQNSELPDPTSVRDIFNNIPKAAFTWYAGVSGGGLFSSLERDSSRPWVLISTALAGAMLSQTEKNPLKLPLEVKHPERVKLVSFSIGANDLCDLSDPFARPETDPLKNLLILKQRFPNAEVFALDPPSVTLIYEQIQKALAELPEGVGRDRIQKYCASVWENVHCPKGEVRYRAESEALRSKILASFRDAGVRSIDPLASTRDWKLLDLISNDCFHPSRLAQDAIYQESRKQFEAFLK